MSDETVIIDGALGEGGGQILRSSVALSGVTGRAVRLENIRANRNPPGLKRQHVTAVLAAARACDGGVEGATVGSTAITFTPSTPRAGEYRFAVGTAGSATLVLQAVLPILLSAGAASSVTVEGGTHVGHAPPFDFFDLAFLPLLRRMGADATATMDRPGFYPAGGGRVTLRVAPAPLRPIELLARGEVVRRRVVAHLAALPGEIADREIAVLKRMTGWPAECFEVRRVPEGEALGPGNAVMIEVGSEHVTEVFSGFGHRGVRAEAVAESALREMQSYLAAGAAVGPHLADQLLLPMALAGGGSFVTSPPTLHATTNAEVIGRFLPARVEATPVGGRNVRVDVRA